MAAGGPPLHWLHERATPFRVYIMHDIIHPAWVVEFYGAPGRPGKLLQEIEGLLTPRQFARFVKRVHWLETLGPRLDAGYFDRVAGSKLRLGEFRLTLEDVEFRVLFSLEPARTYVMLAAYKEQRGGIPRSAITTAEQRLLAWRDRHHAD
jgi:hypothetical protein